MTKKIVEMILIVGMLVSLIGCGNSNSESGDMETSNIEAVETVETVEVGVQNMETKEINASASSEEEEYTYPELFTE